MVKYYYDWKMLNEYSYIETERSVQLYSLIYYLDGGTNSSDNVSILEQGSNFTLNNPVKIGYRFIGWYTEANYIHQVNIISNISDDYNLYALFELSTYSITYHLNGGTNAIKNPSKFTYEDIIVLKDATKIGYSFEGWYTNDKFTNQLTTIQNIVLDLDLYANYIPNKYNLKLNANQGKFTVKVNLHYNHSFYENKIDKVIELTTGDVFKYFTPPAPTSGHVFIGWFKSKHYCYSEETTHYYDDIYKFDEPITKDIVWAHRTEEYWDTPPFTRCEKLTNTHKTEFTISHQGGQNASYDQYLYILTRNSTLNITINFDVSDHYAGEGVKIYSSSKGLVFSSLKANNITFTVDCNFGDYLRFKAKASCTIKLIINNLDTSEI